MKPALMMRRLLALLVVLVAAPSTDGTDLSPWGRHERHHGDWITVEFRDPLSGLFLAARAGTEDPPNKATLTFTMAPARDCVADLAIIVKTDAPASEDSENSAAIAARIDDSEPRRYEALIVRQRNDPFMFVQLLDEPRPDRLTRHKTLTVALPDGRWIGFSLKGFDSAWQAIDKLCRSFMAP